MSRAPDMDMTQFDKTLDEIHLWYDTYYERKT